MSGFIDVNTSLSAIMAMGSQFKVRAEEFEKLAKPTQEKIIELIQDIGTYGDDKPGEAMRAQHPKADDIKAIYANHAGLSESAAQIGDNVRYVMALYEAEARKSKEDMDGVEI
ncbi:hypothetical protein SacmaDRAFT_0252 [Saccharomonospora marina XMU15]|uniref:Uncharacterized protein n=1 Tax=Saccharomonospora marina XMU15 TaxID=882083 RepID=H5X0A2_9PSEU|nr:hypothetical protein [Saccharomonospora marina]EHR48562.1 hypothetical protein SacmaDRAFT_0252 [Saccharomonospora marina XMU15]